MASAEHEPITGVWGQSPQRGPGTEPPETESILVIGCPTEPANLAHCQKCPYRKQYALLRSTGVTVGGPRVHGAPNSVIGGMCPRPPPAPPPMQTGALLLESSYIVNIA